MAQALTLFVNLIQLLTFENWSSWWLESLKDTDGPLSLKVFLGFWTEYYLVVSDAEENCPIASLIDAAASKLGNSLDEKSFEFFSVHVGLAALVLDCRLQIVWATFWW